MKSGTKLVLIFGGIGFVLMFVIIIAFMAFTFFGVSKGTELSRENYKKRTADAVGTISNVSLATSSKIYTYKYVVNGAPYSGEWMTTRSKVENNYEEKVGMKVYVCYDPADPNSSEFSFSEFYQSGDKKGEKMVCGKS